MSTAPAQRDTDSAAHNKPTPPTAPLSRLGSLAITTGGLGHLRPAPGTWGSLPPCIAAAVLAAAGQTGTPAWYLSLSAIVVLCSAVCVRLGHRAEATFGRKDPSQVVADETAGMALTLLALPWWWLPASPARLHAMVPPWVPDWLPLWHAAAIAVAFVLFRLFDILKLPPAHGLQRLTGGWGILVDDLVAGLQAGGVLLAVAAAAHVGGLL